MQTRVESFIGRKRELAQLTHWLEDATDSLVFYLYDELSDPTKKGGIGKTWLLRQFALLVGEQKDQPVKAIPVVIDFFNVADRDGITVAERIVRALQEHYVAWIPQAFEKNLRLYREALQTKNPDTAGMLARLSSALADDLRLLHERMVEANQYILLLFDTFELIEDNPITAVLHTSHTFPETYSFDRIRCVVAGRNALNMKHPNWIGREHDITFVSLSPFSYEETIQFLEHHNSYSLKDQPEGILRALHRCTEGRPILLGLVTDVLSRSEMSLKELVAIKQDLFEESLVTQINNFGDPLKWATFFMAHIYHRFDLEFLQLIMNSPGLEHYIAQVEYQELLRRLPTLSYVRCSGSSPDFVLHDEMRRLVNKYCLEKQDPNGDFRRNLSQLAVGYYEKKMELERHEGTRQSYVVELLFHHLVIDKERGFTFFKEHFDRAIEFSERAFARSLFQEMQKFGELFPRKRFSLEQQHVLQMDEAKLLREEENYEAALKIFAELELDTAWAEHNRSNLLYEKGPCYRGLGKYGQAITCFETCAEIYRSSNDLSRYATVLSRLGYLYRLQGRYAEAMQFYEDALKVQRNLDNPLEFANLLNNIGNVQRLRGKLEEALSSCKLALRTRRDLFRQGKVSEYDVALSLSTLGHIYHTLGVLPEEEKSYREAFDIYSRLGDRSALAHAHNNLGRVLVRKGDLKDALAEFQHAARIAAGEKTAEIESLNQQGRVFLQQGNWERARDFFEQAEALSRQFYLRFQIAENLLYLAEALDHLEQPSSEQMKEAKRIARENDYSYLLARAGEIQGDMYFRRQEYQSAFKYYRVLCRHMALRSSPEFDRTLRKLNDQLLEVPGGFLPAIIDSLLMYWYELGLSEQYPQLLRVCREVSRNMLL
jgi:tetratricopeptide (TPR) repeat protein